MLRRVRNCRGIIIIINQTELNNKQQSYYRVIWSHVPRVGNYFGIKTVSELIRDRFEKFITSYDTYAVGFLPAVKFIVTVLYIYIFLVFLATVDLTVK